MAERASRPRRPEHRDHVGGQQERLAPPARRPHRRGQGVSSLIAMLFNHNYLLTTTHLVTPSETSSHSSRRRHSTPPMWKRPSRTFSPRSIARYLPGRSRPTGWCLSTARTTSRSRPPTMLNPRSNAVVACRETSTLY